MTPSPTSRPGAADRLSASDRLGLADRLRLAAVTTRLSVLLEDLPARRSREIRQDVEAELLAAAADGGMRQAVAGLGSLRVLAEGYKEAEGRPLPRWWTGGAAAFVVAAAWIAGAGIYVAGLLDGSTAAGPGPTSVTGWYLWSDVVATRSADSIGMSFEGHGPLVGLATTAIVFFVAGRGWRLMSGRPSRRAL